MKFHDTAQRRQLYYLVALALLALLKLWLVHGEEIYGAAGEYDQILNLKASRYWYWGAPYTFTAFMRPPGLPLWIAINHAFGIPLRFASELLQLGSYVFLVSALRGAGLPKLVCVLAYAAMIFHPESYQGYNQLNADAFYAAMLGLSLAALLRLLLNNSKLYAVVAGVFLAVLYHTREEGFLIFSTLLVFFLLCWWRDSQEQPSLRSALRVQLGSNAILGAVFLVLVLSVDFLNYRSFGSFAKSEMSSGPFSSAFKALMRLRPDHPKRFIPISRESLQLAYRVSPTFRKLEGQLEGDMGHGWERETLSSLGVPGEIAAGWMPWVIRDAASREGFHKDAATANEFYRAIAREINQACDEKIVPSRLVVFSFLDPHAFASLSYLPAAMKRIGGLFTLSWHMNPNREDAVLRGFQRDWYDELTDRRSNLTNLGRQEIDGWAFRQNDPVILAEFRNTERAIDSSTSNFQPRPDVVQYFAKEESVPLNSQFHLAWLLYREDDSAGEIRFLCQSGASFSIPWETVSRAHDTITSSSGGAPLQFHLDAVRYCPTAAEAAVRAENFVGRNYRHLVRALTYLSVVAVVLLLVQFRRWRADWRVPAMLALLAITIATRFMFFSFIHATSWPGSQPRYLFPIMPLYSCFAIALIAQSFRIMVDRDLRARFRTSNTEAPR